MSDPINPDHYKVNGLECIDVIEKLKLPFHLANALKYIWRAGKKGSAIEDIKKARWYLDRYINSHVSVLNAESIESTISGAVKEIKTIPALKPEYTIAYNYSGKDAILWFGSEQSARWCIEALNKGTRNIEEYAAHKVPAGINMSQSWAVVEV